MEDILRKMMNLPPQATDLAVGLDRLNMVIFLTTIFAAVVIGGVTLVFSLQYRRTPRSPATTQHIEVPHLVEVAFFIVPLVIFLGWFYIGFGQFKELTRPPENSMDVFVMGKKWMWKFAYPEGPSGVNILRVPARRPVRLLMTSRDVLHSFYVPAFRIKQDVLPGKYTQTWFEANQTGTFHIFCAEYCGTDHSHMRGEVIVMEPEAFDEWREQQMKGHPQQADTAAQTAAFNTSMVDEGRSIAAQVGCFKCHSINGDQHIGPSFAGLYRRKAVMQDGTELIADESYITESMMDPNKRQVQGYNLVMPSFQGILQPLETAAIVEFIKSLPAPETRPEGPAYQPIPGVTLPGNVGSAGNAKTPTAVSPVIGGAP